MRRRGGWLLAAMCMSLVSVQAARADDAAAARFHDERAREHYARGRYEAAIREFFLEQRIAPNPRIVFNIALCFQLLGEDAEAFQMYTEYLADADADEDEDRRRQARDAVEELAPRVSRLRVTSNPPGAEIYVDHEEHGSYGRTPTVIAVSPGEHRVVLTRSLHRSAETTVQADRGQESAVELDLTPITGSLEVTASVDGGATVRTPAGRTVASGDTPLSVDLPPGPYAVAVTAEGWQRDRSLIEVRAELTTRHHADLVQVPGLTGTLTVTSNRPGALVTLDDSPAGFTPLVLEDVPVGPRSLRVERDGDQPWRGELDVRVDAPTWLTVTLEEEEAGATHSPATWILGASGGATLLAGAGVGIAALDARAAVDQAVAEGRDDVAELRQRGQTLNAVADTLFIVGGAILVAAVILFLIEAGNEPQTTSADISRGEHDDASE